MYGNVLVIFVAVVALAGAGRAAEVHIADQDANFRISFTELGRLIQFYNVGAYHCEVGTEDDYAPGTGDQSCPAHDLDYKPTDWKINLTELLRLIQIYNGGGYFACPEGEDGFCWRSKEPRPNVVLLVLDTLRADRIGMTRDGALIMPFLTEFIASSKQFVNAWSPSSWTEPSMSSVFTSRHPEHYVVDIPQAPGGQSTNFDLTEDDETMAEWLARYGYSNWGVQANAFIQVGTVLGQGFVEGQYNFFNGNPSMFMTDTALGWVDELQQVEAQGSPFLLYMQYMDAHGPYTPVIDFPYPFQPEPTLTGTDAIYLNYSFWSPYTRDLLLDYFGADPREYGDLTANGVAALRGRYDRDCYYMDTHLARLITEIREEFPNTVFIITADHGESILDRGQIIGHGHSVFQEQVHVPFAIKLPGNDAGEIITRRISNMSLMPTLARILGISPEPHWEGTDLLYAEATDAPQEPVFAFTRSTMFGNRIEAKTVVDGDLKLVDDTHFGPPRLFNLVSDPGELTDLAASLPEDLARLQAIRDAHDVAVGLK